MTTGRQESNNSRVWNVFPLFRIISSSSEHAILLWCFYQATFLPYLSYAVCSAPLLQYCTVSSFSCSEASPHMPDEAEQDVQVETKTPRDVCLG